MPILIFTMPAATAWWSRRRHAGRAVQYQRHVNRAAQPGDQAESRLAVRSVMAWELPTATASAVHAGRRGEGRRLGRVGARPGGVGAVLAADPASSASTQHPRVVGPGGDPGGGVDVLLVGQRGGVEHHRADAGRDARPQQVLVLDVVQVQGDRDRGAGGEGGGARETGSGPPLWKATVFWLICRITGSPVRSAAAVIASACSRVMTLKAAMPWPEERAAEDEFGGGGGGHGGSLGSWGGLIAGGLGV